MSKNDSSLSKDQYNLLKSFKKQITHPHSSALAKQAEAKVQAEEQEQEDDLDFFRKQMQGVQKILPSWEKIIRKNLTHKLWLNALQQ